MAAAASRRNSNGTVAASASRQNATKSSVACVVVSAGCPDEANWASACANAAIASSATATAGVYLAATTRASQSGTTPYIVPAARRGRVPRGRQSAGSSCGGARDRSVPLEQERGRPLWRVTTPARRGP